MNKEKIIKIYNEALEKYKDSSKPNNYIPNYIKRRLDHEITTEELHYIIFSDEIIYKCKVCNNNIPFSKFGKFTDVCSAKCRYNSMEFRNNISKSNKGKSKSTKGKTYKEIYGTDNPKCGFKTGNDNIAKNEDIRKKISENVKKSYDDELRAKRSEQAYNSGFIGGNFKKAILDSKGQNYRSSLEVKLAELFYGENIEFEYEKRIKLYNNKVKIVDFVIDNIFIEVTGYAYDSWQEDLQKKIKWLRGSLSSDEWIILITYPDKEEQLLIDSCNNKLGNNIIIKNINDETGIINTIKFIKEVSKLSKEIECLE